MRSLSRVTNHQ